MADEEKTEEVAEEVTEETTETTEESTDESKETEADVAELKAHEDFDKLIDDDEAEEAAEQTEATEEKTETEETKETKEKPAEKADEETKTETEEKDTGTVEETAKTEDVPDDSLLERAVVAGISLGDARDTKAATLERIVVAMEKKSEKTEKVVEEKPFDCELSLDDYTQTEIDLHNKIGQQAQDTKLAMEKMAAEHKEALEGVTDKTTAITAKQARANMDRQMDSYFDGMKGFDKVFGKGGINTMDAGTPEFEKRMDVEDMMLVLLRGHKASGGDMPTDDVLFKQAVGIVCPEEISKVALSTKTKKIAAQREQVIGSGGKESESATTRAEKVDKIQKDFDAKIDED